VVVCTFEQLAYARDILNTDPAQRCDRSAAITVLQQHPRREPVAVTHADLDRMSEGVPRFNKARSPFTFVRATPQPCSGNCAQSHIAALWYHAPISLSMFCSIHTEMQVRIKPYLMTSAKPPTTRYQARCSAISICQHQLRW